MSERLRSFIAVPLAERTREQLTRLSRELRAALDPLGRTLSYVRPAAMHLTLKFLGDVDAERVPALAGVLQETARPFRAIPFEVAAVGFFGSPRRPRVLWVGVREPSGALAGLAGAIDRACAGLGFDPEERPFRAHLTLARVKQPPGRGIERPLERFREALLGAERAEEVVLYRSELRPEGARYTALARAPLSAP